MLNNVHRDTQRHLNPKSLSPQQYTPLPIYRFPASLFPRPFPSCHLERLETLYPKVLNTPTEVEEKEADKRWGLIGIFVYLGWEE